MSDIDIRSCIPKHTSDIEAVERVMQIGYPAIEPVLYDLLMWLQDGPLVGPMGHALKPVGLPLIPHIRRVLRGRDGAWKRNLLTAFVVGNREFYMALKEDIKRLCENPSEDDQMEEVDVYARELMDDFA